MSQLDELFQNLQTPYPPMGSQEERERLAKAVKAEADLNDLKAELDRKYGPL